MHPLALMAPSPPKPYILQCDHLEHCHVPSAQQYIEVMTMYCRLPDLITRSHPAGHLIHHIPATRSKLPRRMLLISNRTRQKPAMDTEQNFQPAPPRGGQQLQCVHAAEAAIHTECCDMNTIAYNFLHRQVHRHSCTTPPGDTVLCAHEAFRQPMACCCAVCSETLPRPCPDHTDDVSVWKATTCAAHNPTQ
jgi:hypothetical protein